MEKSFSINGREIGREHRVYLVAEMSANHGQDFDRAVEILKAAKRSGADAIKLQTYTADTLTIDCSNEYFQIKSGPWAGRTLYDLYGEAFTPWEWQPLLMEAAHDLELDFFSTPFDRTAVEFLEEMNVPCYKVASFELVDLPLLKEIAGTGKPVIMSTGMASLGEIEEAVETLRGAGCTELAILKCSSAYPAQPDELNLATIPHLSEAFQVPVGLSDHTLDLGVPITAVALGACIIEKHFTLSRSDPGPDSAFSLEPHEFKAMAEAVRTAKQALGSVQYGISEREIQSRVFRRSLFVVKDIAAGEAFSHEHVRSIRPGNGLHTRHLGDILGRKACRDISAGTPVGWNLLE